MYMCMCVQMCTHVSVFGSVCVCVFVSKNDQASCKTQTLDSCFGLVGSHQQGAVMLEPEECCTLTTKWTVPHLSANIPLITPVAVHNHNRQVSMCLCARTQVHA